MFKSSKFKTSIAALGLIGILGSNVWAQSDEEKIAKRASQIELQILKLESELNQKSVKLETLESKRWDKRYRQTEKIKGIESKNKELESQYSRKADAVGRVKEQHIAAKNAAKDAKDLAEEANNRQKALNSQIATLVDESAKELSGDFPIQLSERVMNLSEASKLAEKNESSASINSLNLLFADWKGRLAQTQKIEMSPSSVTTESGVQYGANRLQLGTEWAADLDRESKQYQVLFRSGALQGQKYVWKSELSPEMASALESALNSTSNQEMVYLPVDVLQSGAVLKSIKNNGEETVSEFLKSWFKQGGIVMYPLVFIALMALLFAFERLLMFLTYEYKLRALKKKVFPLIRNREWAAAEGAAAQADGEVARFLERLLGNRNRDRVWAEKQGRQLLIQETPKLEKRLNFISVLGATAPLLGLLGTVSGMINLFKVITQAGTNDARTLAGGISEALVTTESGLIVAIPILLIHGFLSERLDALDAKLNETVLETVNRAWDQEVTATLGKDGE